jgi:hypothetical protein
MKVSMAVVATMTRGTVITGEDSRLWSAGVDDMTPKENIKISLWHLYVDASMKTGQARGLPLSEKLIRPPVGLIEAVRPS